MSLQNPYSASANNDNNDAHMESIEHFNDMIIIPSKEKIESQINSTINNLEIPLNTIKEKVEFCLPPNIQIEDNAIIAINKSLNGFLCYFAKKIRYENNKIMVKNIKTTIETEKTFAFLRKLTEK